MSAGRIEETGPTTATFELDEAQISLAETVYGKDVSDLVHAVVSGGIGSTSIGCGREDCGIYSTCDVALRGSDGTIAANGVPPGPNLTPHSAKVKISCDPDKCHVPAQPRVTARVVLWSLLDAEEVLEKAQTVRAQLEEAPRAEAERVIQGANRYAAEILSEAEPRIREAEQRVYDEYRKRFFSTRKTRRSDAFK